MTTDFAALIARLTDADVEFIIVGGVAGTIHGAGRATADLDVVYRRTPQNTARLLHALTSWLRTRAARRRDCRSPSTTGRWAWA